MVEKRRRLWLLSFSSKLPNPYAMFDHKKIKVHQKPRLLRVCPECGYGHYESRVSCVPPPPYPILPTRHLFLPVNYRVVARKLFVSSRNFFKIVRIFEKLFQNYFLVIPCPFNIRSYYFLSFAKS